MDSFGEAVGRKVRRLYHTPETAVAVGGCDPIRPYYKPRDRQGNFIDILKVKLPDETTRAVEAIEAAGFKVLSQEEL